MYKNNVMSVHDIAKTTNRRETTITAAIRRYEIERLRPEFDNIKQFSKEGVNCHDIAELYNTNRQFIASIINDKCDNIAKRTILRMNAARQEMQTHVSYDDVKIIAKKYKIKVRAFRKYLMQHGITIGLPPNKIQRQCVELYEQGKTRREIQNILGVSYPCVHKHIKDYVNK